MGGRVFGNGSDPIRKEFIQSTINHFINDFVELFPGVSKYFLNPQTLGSVGKKDVSGDIDLAIDEKCFDRIEDWNLDKDKVEEKFIKFKKRARTATNKALYKRAIIHSIAEIINNSDSKIVCSEKSSGSGILFCEYPQYDNNNELELRVQIDINFGNIDWLKFSYFSDSYSGNIKGLHRTQLMLHLFAYKGYGFIHNSGVKNSETQEVVATTPNEAIKLLNNLYNIHITEDILQNYFKLQEYIKANISEEELHGIYDIYLKTLDSTRCDIPDDLQEYWKRNQNRLNLKGKFLPESSNLYIYQNI